MLSAVGYGKILQDKNGKLKELQKYTLQKYKNGLPKLSQEDVIYEAKSLQKSIEYLRKMKQCMYNDEDDIDVKNTQFKENLKKYIERPAKFY